MVEQPGFAVRSRGAVNAEEAGQPNQRQPPAQEPPPSERAAPAKQAPDDADSAVMAALLKRMEAAEDGASRQSANLAKIASDNERLASDNARLASENERLASDVAQHASDIARLKIWATEHRSP